MSDFQVDLTNCDIEPIHIPGLIQTHGFLIVVNSDNRICYFSENISEYITGMDNPLGLYIKDLEVVFGEDYQAGLIGRIIAAGRESKSFQRTNPLVIEIAGFAYYLIISKSYQFCILEFEPALSDFDLDVQSMMGSSIAEILSYDNMQELLTNAAIQVRQVIGFDRVMIYQFAEDGHGEVVAENKNDDLLPWLGLHYPASDIPKQARELYKLNLTRLIADVNAPTSSIKTVIGNEKQLDLTYSQLRAVSPIHIQYLRNMGVSSSFSISLKLKNELWGLIACHNYKPKFIDFKSREYSKLIGQILSSALEFRQNEAAMQAKDNFKINLEKLAKQLIENEHVEDALNSKEVTLLDIVKCTGAALVYNKKIYKLGTTPNDKQLLELVSWIVTEIKEPVFHSTQFSEVFPGALAYKDSASGVLISVLSWELGDYLIWFRGEQVKDISWAGHPDKTVNINENGLMDISPRNSFEVWIETISGVAESWSLEEIKAVIKLKEEVNYGVNRKADGVRIMNDRLRQAYEELESFSYTISHDLKSPIASIKSYAQLLIKDQMVLERGQKMLQRIADRADQMNLMINAVLDYSRIGRTEIVHRPIHTNGLVNDIIKDLDLVYDIGNLEITVGDLPDMKGDPMMMLQVFSNLIGNAVKYSQFADPSIVQIDGEIDEHQIRFTIRDNGIGVAATDLPKIFELFNRMENVKDIEGSGVGLAIVKRIVEKHKGEIWAESELDKGSIFHLSFNH